MKDFNWGKLISRIVLVLAIFTFILTASCEQTVWDCPECGKTGNAGNFCGKCAHPAPWTTLDPNSASKQTLAISSNHAPKLITEFYPNGKIKKQYEYDSDDNLLQITQYDRYGNILNYEISKEWDKNGYVTKSEFHPIIYSVYSRSGGDYVSYKTENAIYICDNLYDEEGNCIYQSEHKENDPDPYPYSLFQYDENNRENMETRYNKDGTIEYIKTAYQYDENDNLLGYMVKNATGKTNAVYEAVWENDIKIKSKSSSSSEIATYIYDPNFGDTLSYSSCDLNGDIRYSDQNRYSSDYYENEICSYPSRKESIPFMRVIRYSAIEKKIEFEKDYSYDKEQDKWYLGEYKEYTYPDFISGRTRVYATNYSNEEEIKGYSERIYDKNAKIIVSKSYDLSGVLNSYREYDNNENLFRWKIYENNGKLKSMYEYEYDSIGQQVKEKHYDQNEELSEYTEYQYDSDGNRIKREIYDKDDRLTRYSAYEYDNTGYNTHNIDYLADGTKYWESFYRKLEDGTRQHKYISYNSDGSIYKEYEWESY